MDEELMAGASAPELRIEEADYFYSQFLKHCGPPADCYFLVVCYFDAFVFALVSIEEMVPDGAKEQIRACSEFRLFKALRNITTHHSVLCAAVADAKFPRPFSRKVSATVGGCPDGSSRLSMRFDILRGIFDAVEKEWPPERRTLEMARACLQDLENRNVDSVFLEDVMAQGLNVVRGVLAGAEAPE